MTSARSAGIRYSECWLTMLKLNWPVFMLKPIGCWGTTTGAGMKPPSVPIWIHGGPAVVGAGIPLAVSANWFAGLTLAGTIFISVQVATLTHGVFALEGSVAPLPKWNPA